MDFDRSEWLTTEEAMKAAGLRRTAFFAANRGAGFPIRRKPAKPGAKGFQNVGCLWFRQDIMDLLNIKVKCKLTYPQAARVLAAVREELI